MKRLHPFVLLAVCFGAALSAMAQPAADYPSKAINLYTPFPGFNDAMARVIGEKLSNEVGQPIVVHHLPGASGAVAAARVKSVGADGYSLLFGSNGMFTINDVFNPSVEYKSSDFIPISLGYSLGMFVLVHPSVPANNLRELIDYAKANPGKLTYGSSGVGTITHMCGEMLASMSSTKMTHIPYKGTAQALTDLIGGRISMLFFPSQESLQHIKSGRVKALAFSTTERSKAMPEVATIAESGIPGYDMKVWYGFFAHSSIPPAALARLSTAIPRAILASDLTSRELVPSGNTSAQFQALILQEKNVLRKIIQSEGIKP